ncbi:MAG: transcriptional coactivator p15/PC4 family protein [Gallionella sp.]
MEKITKGREEVRVSVRQYKGKAYVDIRTFWFDDAGVAKPSPKGVTIPFNKFEEFKNCLARIDTSKVDEDLDIQ